MLTIRSLKALTVEFLALPIMMHISFEAIQQSTELSNPSRIVNSYELN